MVSTVNNFLDGAFGKLLPEQRNWLEKLSHHTQSLEQLLNEIIEMIRSEKNGESHIVNKDVGSATAPLASLKSAKHQNIFHWNRTPKILVVDDEPDILDTIRQALELKGFESATCAEGKKAKHLALELEPDLIIMDVNLKDGNGIDVCRDIKSHLSAYTPVLIITGQGDLSMKISGDKDDPDDLLIKPFQIPELFTRVTSMLRLKKLHEDLEKLMKDKKDN
jgi:PleD family two-component response regulator